MTETIRFRGRISRADFEAMLEEVRANTGRLEGCARHRFDHPGIALDEKCTCLNCGGRLDLREVGAYIAGYRAAGAAADDIWPGWK